MPYILLSGCWGYLRLGRSSLHIHGFYFENVRSTLAHLLLNLISPLIGEAACIALNQIGEPTETRRETMYSESFNPNLSTFCHRHSGFVGTSEAIPIKK